MVSDLCTADFRSVLEQKLSENKQHQGQSVIAFISKMKDVCRRYDKLMEEKQTIRKIMKGILSEIRQYLDQQEIKTVQDLMTRAKKQNKQMVEIKGLEIWMITEI